MTTMSKHLVVVCAGDTSLHTSYTTSQSNFDVFVSYYGSDPDVLAANEGNPMFLAQKGPKWPCIAKVFELHPEFLQQYQAIWLPDDDIDTTAHNVNRMFGLFVGMDLQLAQPALTSDSHYCWRVLLQRPEFLLRYSEYVEPMVPIFSQAALRNALPSFTVSKSGWGLDWAWPSMIRKGIKPVIAILDATPVRHTRPLGGNLYSNNPSLKPWDDVTTITSTYNVPCAPAKFEFGILGVVRATSLPWRARLAQWFKRLTRSKLVDSTPYTQ